MSIVVYIVLTILLCVLPAGVVWLCNRVSVLGKLGPIMVLYAVGMVVGNLPALGGLSHAVAGCVAQCDDSAGHSDDVVRLSFLAS